MKIPKYILPVIVLAQFCCTSMWFAGNGVMGNLVNDFGLKSTALGHLTSAVQFGFITGTLIFAIFTIADRYSPSMVFLISSIIGASFNVFTIFEWNNFESLLLFRFLTGFFLAGIYPVGMKIAADYFDKDLGRSLGFLVGALAIGTGFPHMLKFLTSDFPWKNVLIITSFLSTTGGLLIAFLVPNGPHRKPAGTPDFFALFRVFKNSGLRSASWGYFGHMWELYTFWAFVPIILGTYTSLHLQYSLNVPLFSFIIIAVGGIACMIGGQFSIHYGAKKVASIALFTSAVCCFVSPFAFKIVSAELYIGFLIIWGMAVMADSPMFSSLVAQNAPSNNKGTALTIVNSIGFSITIVSIQLLNTLSEYMNHQYLYVILGFGPALGLYGLLKKNL